MEGLAHLVAESMVRHGFEPSFDHRRLQWSSWFRCQDSFTLVLAPCKPGLFALGEEIIAPGEMGVGEGKRMLALFQISEADDLGMALGRLFLSRNPERERLTNGRCFARYVVIEDASQRRAAYAALQRWMTSTAEAAIGVTETPVAPDAPVRGAEQSSAGVTPIQNIENPGPVSTHAADKTSFESSHDGEKQGLASSHDAQEAQFVSGQAGEKRFVSGHDFSRAATAASSTAALAAAPADASLPSESSNKQAQIGPPSPIPSGF
jgi:hypothetical protein